MTCGIYVIRNRINGKVYVGSSVRIERRWNGHRSDLRNNKHHSLRLQRSWNKYGEAAFEFEVVETAPIDALTDRENSWMVRTNAFNPANGYNVCPAAGTVRGLSRTTEQLLAMREVGLRNGFSDKCREAQRVAWQGDRAKAAQAKSVIARKANGNYVFSEQHKQNMSKAFRSRPDSILAKRLAISPEGVRVVKEALSMGWLVRHIAYDMGVCKNTILKIKNGTYGNRYGTYS